LEPAGTLTSPSPEIQRRADDAVGVDPVVERAETALVMRELVGYRIAPLVRRAASDA
jgi:hypothetical protein